jgi:long-chain acyl-CoA synthetase
LYDGSSSIHTETEVTYEDGRKGKISATLQIKDATTNSVADLAAQ